MNNEEMAEEEVERMEQRVDDSFDTTLENLHSVELLEKGGGDSDLVFEHGRWESP